MTLPLTPEILVYDLVQASDPQISPDGTQIVYTRTAVDRETKQAVAHLWRCDIGGGNARHLRPEKLPGDISIVDNRDGILGGIRLWEHDSHPEGRPA